MKNPALGLILYCAWAELRRAGDVSPLILREAPNQGIDIPRSPKQDLKFDREQNDSYLNPDRFLSGINCAITYGMTTVAA